MSSITQRLRRRLLAVTAAGALTAGALAFTATPAQAAPVTTKSESSAITGATLTWGLNGEQGGGAFFGGCNFLSAGTAGNTGSSRLWTEGDGFYKTTDGNVTVEKPDTENVYAQPTWATKCQTPGGTEVSASSVTSLTKNRVKIANGTGTVNTTTGAATISWTGSFTSVFYGGLTYWSAANPKLTVAADGTAKLTATASGYGTSMDDMTQWVPITPREITLANLTDVDVDADGFTVTPDYLGKTVTSSSTPQSTAGASWGSFPQSFVDFQQLTGQSSYWYSSGGSRDAAKPASPLAVSYTATTPEVTVSETTINPDGTTDVTVTGKNFLPTLATGARPPLAGQAAGAYVTLGKFAPAWRPSTGAASSSRVTATAGTGGLKWAVPAASMATVGGAPAGAVELSSEGTFSTTLTVNKAALDTAVAASANAANLTNYGIYSYPGSGGVQAAYETYTPISFGTAPVEKDDASVSLDKTGYEGLFGDEIDVETQVSVDGDVAASGDVELEYTPAGGEPSVVDTDTLAEGSATLQVPATTAVGQGTLKVNYLGNDTTNTASSEAAQVVISTDEEPEPEATPSTTTLTAPAGKHGVTGKATVTVKAEGKTVGGTVTLTGDGSSRTATVRNGVASFNLSKKLTAKTYTLKATYESDDEIADSSTTRAYTVTKGSATAKISSTTKPTTSAKGSTRVTVTSPGVTPGGKVRVLLTKSGKTYQSTTGTVNSSGRVRVTLPKLNKRGTWNVVVRYYGDTNHLRSDSKKTTIKVAK